MVPRTCCHSSQPAAIRIPTGLGLRFGLAYKGAELNKKASPMRKASIARKTAETEISVTVNLDPG